MRVQVISMKTCCHCKLTKLYSEFSRHSRSRDGMQPWCKDCVRDTRAQWPQDAARHAQSEAKMRKLYPERVKARMVIKYLVRTNRLPAARTVACVDCGGAAREYDHYLGYDRPRDVQPVCSKCHGLRDRARGEHAEVWKARIV
jgi:hypothetical protein